MRELKLFTGNSNPALAQEICDYLGIPLGEATVGHFSDGEIQVRIEENVRGMDVFLLQSASDPVNKHIMELLIMLDALKRASAYRITAVLPYYGYARQDRKDQPRVPITAKLVADLIATAGAHRVLTIDLHAGQIQGFFNIPVDHLYATPVLLEHFRQVEIADLVIVSPDAGGVE
ncbi:MAG TPA: ribose-phosphate diphosphokinase, partial [Nitrospiria bacterium]|nr:ribose-phosphate diphosphokinase [Nitrospiria bacterium]